MKDVKHGSKVKGNAKNELSHLTRSAILCQSNITVTLHFSLIKSLAFLSGNSILDPAGRWSFLSFLFSEYEEAKLVVYSGH